jgi:hypothetical protein
MSELPNSVLTSKLWQRLSGQDRLKQCLQRIRQVVEVLAGKISEILPEFTDHSVKHLDALWSVADHVLTETESQTITPSEAFVLGSAFYLHDLGMAFGATSEGLSSLRGSESYRANQARLVACGMPKEQAEKVALKIAARAEHAKQASSLVTQPIPGLQRYLIEDSEIRTHWAETIGNVAASHHWSLSELDRFFGVQGKIPDPLGGTFDLGFVACVLRIVDYAHINLSRASILERALRPNIPQESKWHWLAQEHIAGPTRMGTQLVYASTRALDDVDAWFTFYELASGLDREITAVNEYLSRRADSRDRFSLEGVQGAKNPQSFAGLVRTADFEPVDVRFRPDSMERLIHILGGRTLYGNDHYAPIRELLQNARDAVELYRHEVEAQSISPEPPRLTMELRKSEGTWRLIFSDNGVGMTPAVITNYLLGIAANYWKSSEFHSEHPHAGHTAFKPVGRFGIGFLSVFMLGNHVEVHTQRRGGPNLRLRLRGIGSRGALVRKAPTLTNGTTVEIQVSDQWAADLAGLNKIVIAKAPMLSVPVDVIQDGQSSRIEPGWWKSIPQEEFAEFLEHQQLASTTPSRLGEAREFDGLREHHQMYLGRHRRSLKAVEIYDKWPGKQPELLDDASRILAVPGQSGVLLCSKGFAVGSLHVPGLLGIVNRDDLELNASRSQPIGLDSIQIRREWLRALRPHIVASLDALLTEGDVPARLEFLNSVASVYGRNLLIETNLPWLTIKEPPGDARQISVNSLGERLHGVREVLITYNVSLWSASRRALERYPEAGRSALVIPVTSLGQPEPGSYTDRDQEIWAPLEEHFGREPYSRGLEVANLLLATIDAIADAWKIPTESLTSINWVRKDKALYGRFVRGQG